jgi:SH3-like domain-containing protein
MAGKPFHWLKRGEQVNVMGFVHNWAAVDINGRLGFAHKNFLSAPPA